MKHCCLLTIFFTTCLGAFSQQVQQGIFHEWDFGPSGVYGNLALTSASGKSCYKIEKIEGQRVKVSKLNPSGVVTGTTMVTFVDGLIRQVTRTDQWGETYDYRDFQIAGKDEFIVIHKNGGANYYLPNKYARYKYEHELLVSISEYSFDGKLTDNARGFAITRYKRYNDSIRFAELEESAYFNSKNEPVVSSRDGYHSIQYEYDLNDNEIAEEYFDIGGRPTGAQGSKVVKVKYTYDAKNNRLKSEYLDSANNRTLNEASVSIVENTYINSYLIQIARLDTAQRLTRTAAFGDSVALIQYNYDSSGNQTRQAYFDANQNAIGSHDGPHLVICSYNRRNMRTEIAFYNDLESAASYAEGFHKICEVRDSVGRISEKYRLDVHDLPIKERLNSVFRIKYKFDEFGRQISESFWKDSTTPMPRWNGAYDIRSKFNENGQLVETGSFDQSGNPFVTSDNSTRLQILYDAQGRIGEKRYMNNQGLVNLATGLASGFAILRSKYAENGKISELNYFDKQGHPVNAEISLGGDEGSFKCTKVLFFFKVNRIVEQWYFKLGDNEPFLKTDCLNHDFILPNGIARGRKNIN